MSGTGHEQRAQRILDAAAGLVLRWGYKRVTIEEVAKHAGIGKGTVYLHFKHVAWLFMCVLMRESLELVDELVAAIRRDRRRCCPPSRPALATSGCYTGRCCRRCSAVMRTAGRAGARGGRRAVARMKASSPMNCSRLLREYGLMRTDLDIDTQSTSSVRYRRGSTCLAPVAAVTAPPEFAAAALGHTICHAVQTPGSPDPDALAALAPKVIAMYEQFRGRLAAASRGKAPEGSKQA